MREKRQLQTKDWWSPELQSWKAPASWKSLIFPLWSRHISVTCNLTRPSALLEHGLCQRLWGTCSMDTVDCKWSTLARPHRTKLVLILECVASLFSCPLLRDISEKTEALSLNSPMLILERAWHQVLREDWVFLPMRGSSQWKTNDAKSIGCQDSSGREGFIARPVFQPFPLVVHPLHLQFDILLCLPTKAQCCPSLITRGSVSHGNGHSSNGWLTMAVVTWIPHLFPIWEKERKANRLA